MAVLESPLGRSVRVVDEGSGPPVVFLHSGVGSPGEWRSVFTRWSGRNRLIAIDVYDGRSGPNPSGPPTVDDYADQVRAVAEYVDGPLHLVGFSWGGATALRVATTTAMRDGWRRSSAGTYRHADTS